MLSVSSKGSAEEARTASPVVVLNRKVEIIGSFLCDGDVVLEGRIEGEVRCKTLRVAERGVVEGDIIADRVIVLGEVFGAIHANELILKTACTVEGQINHRNLVLENGCFFEGKSRRHPNPLHLAPPLDA
jgi:cytoskeletal protein CcmA (bactofilin family)